MATFFRTPADFREWLAAHAATASELVVGFYKTGSGKPSITWPESVDEALCVGWIDGVRKRIDDESYQIRFTARKATSIWSAVNISRVAALTAEGRMQPAGLAAFARRSEQKSKVYAYEQSAESELSTSELAQFRKQKKAWTFFEAQAPSYRRQMIWWVISAKRADTRESRLVKLIAASAEGRRL